MPFLMYSSVESPVQSSLLPIFGRTESDKSTFIQKRKKTGLDSK